MMQPMQQMQPQAPMQAPVSAAGPAPTKSKGIKLKNATLTRFASKTSDGDDAVKPAGSVSRADSDAKADDKADQAKAAIAQSFAVPEVETKKRHSLNPGTGVFERLLMLRIGRSIRGEKNAMMEGLFVGHRPGE